MSEATALPVRHDDLGLLYRRTELEKQGVTFGQAPPVVGMPRYPLRWVASWRADGTDHESEPMPMPALIPHMEKMTGGQP
jgi:hypothetical protein